MNPNQTQPPTWNYTWKTPGGLTDSLVRGYGEMHGCYILLDLKNTILQSYEEVKYLVVPSLKGRFVAKWFLYDRFGQVTDIEIDHLETPYFADIDQAWEYLVNELLARDGYSFAKR